MSEEYTSKLCSKCGTLGEKYVKRKKRCENCKYEINRDVNGSRNILLKNAKENMKIKAESLRETTRKPNHCD